MTAFSSVLGAAGLSALVLAGSAATAASVDFNGGTGCTGADYTITQGSPEAACRFSIPGFLTPNTTNGLIGVAPSESFWTVRFNSLMSMVSIELGDLGVDSENLFLAAYDETNTLISTFTLAYGTSNGMRALTLDFGTNIIKWATFGSSNGGIYADNFAYDRIETSPVPLPAGGALVVTGLAALGLLRRRKASSAV